MEKLFNVTVELNYIEDVEVEIDTEEYDNPEEIAEDYAERIVSQDLTEGHITIESFEMDSETEEVN